MNPTMIIGDMRELRDREIVKDKSDIIKQDVEFNLHA